MGRPALTQRIAQVRNFTTGTLDSTSNRTRHRRRGACSHALWPTQRTSLAKPKNPHAALVYLVLEPLSLGIRVKARCGLAKRRADSVCHLPKSAGNNTRDRNTPGAKVLKGSSSFASVSSASSASSAQFKRLFQPGPRMVWTRAISIVADAADGADGLMQLVLAYGRYP